MSPFKIQGTISTLIFWTYWEQIQKAWMLWNWSDPNGMEAYSWKFIKSFDEIKFIQEVPSITLFHPWIVVHSQIFFAFMWIEWPSPWCSVRQDVPLNFTGLLFCAPHSSCSSGSDVLHEKKNNICFYNPTWDSSAQPQGTKI
jgi:hypothetical protein